ncbi:MAG: hypothetical protein NT062_17210 [Proteobacteria bacterium]|nr:hypothetical protein [Pseudomonadota bacterium]
MLRLVAPLVLACGCVGIRSISAPEIREVSAPRIRVVSAAGLGPMHDDASAALPAPHRVTLPAIALHAVDDLRALVGRRDPRPSRSAALAWARELRIVDRQFDLATAPVRWRAADGEPHRAAITAGDLLVFAVDELVAIAVSPTEFIYVAGGVVRRGLIDPLRPTSHRNDDGTIANTYLRHGSKWPPKGTRYLSGELLAAIVR